MNDLKQKTLENETEKVQSQKRSTLKLNYIIACLLIVFLAIIAYLMYSFRIIDNLEQAAKENKECIAQVLQAEYDIKSNSVYAAEAMKLAEKAMSENDFDLAKIYSLNAINHMPYEIKYIEAYFQLLEKQSPTQEELKRFVDILDMSVFQIAPVEIKRVIAIKSTILQKLEAISIVEQEKSSKDYQETLAQKIDSLVKGELSLPHIISGNGNVNIDMLSARIETIKAILEESVLDEMETTKWNSELANANIIFQLAVTLASVENAASKADTTTAKTSQTKMELVTAQNQLQTANALLTQIWTMDCSVAPELLEKAKAYQTKITEIDARIKELGSKPAFINIKEQVENIHDKYSQSLSKPIQNKKTPDKKTQGIYTESIKQISSYVEKIKENLAEISDDKMQIEVLDDLKKAGDFLQELSKFRYNDYQKWALGQLQECHNEFLSFKLLGFKRVTDAQGNKLFNTYLLDINPALLSYDMQSLYNSIYQEVYEEVGNKAESQITKASNDCMSLENL